MGDYSETTYMLPSPSASKQQKQQECDPGLFVCKAFAPYTIPATTGTSTEGSKGPLSTGNVD